jgi:hypothetical protein
MAVDLHTHSTASDGSDTPEDLMARAAALGLTAIALTDHDTLEGIARAETAAAAAGIELVPGVEISLEWPTRGMHLVVLFLEPGDGPLQSRLGALQASRRVRNRRIVGRLCELGLPLTIEEVETQAAGGSVGRPHVAAAMVERGYVPDPAVAFDLYLAAGRPAYVDRLRLEPEEAIGLARRSGAVPVLAHPHTLGIDDRREMTATLERLVAAGLVGLECHYGTYEREGRSGMVALARRFGLVPAGGSDFHGRFKPDIRLGTGRVGLPVPGSVLEDLRPFAGVRR